MMATPCGSHLQHADVTATEILRTFANPGGVIQQTSAIAEQLFAIPRQQQATPNTIEQFETEFLFEIADLPGQSGLSNAQA